MELNEFWAALDRLADESQLIIDRPRGSAHPQFPTMIYPVDYGYLQNTASMDGDGIDVWHGSATDAGVSAVICTVDLMKRDSEIKLLIGCTESEIQQILQLHNQSEFMKGLLIRRPNVR